MKKRLRKNHLNIKKFSFQNRIMLDSHGYYLGLLYNMYLISILFEIYCIICI